tara:strand:+ start:1054 stop:2538 length:1485 start_codon:yes stop_codon:yes gene_type:complete
MGRGTEARSRAELSAAEAEAGGQLRLGDITQQKWSGLGQNIGQGIDAYVTEQREAPIREQEARLRGLNIERTEQLLAAGKVEAAQGEQDRQRDRTRDRILATAQTRFTDPNGEVDAEGATAWVQEQFALQLPPSYLEAYQVRQRATEEHGALMTSHEARAEEAQLGSDTHRLEIERLKEADRLFKEMTRIDDTHGLDTPESDAAHLAYYGYTRTADPRIAIREGQLDREARIKAASMGRTADLKDRRAFLSANYQGALAGGNRSAIHKAEQALYAASIDPRTLREPLLQNIYDDEIKRHNLRVGAPGALADPGREEFSTFDDWRLTANLPDVSTLGSVYEPPPPLEPLSIEGAITESELAAEVEKHRLSDPDESGEMVTLATAMEEAAASYRSRGIDVVEDDGSPSWLGKGKPARRSRSTDINLPASSASVGPPPASDVSEPGTQWGRQLGRLTRWGQDVGDIAQTAAAKGAAISRRPLLTDRPLASPPLPRVR